MTSAIIIVKGTKKIAYAMNVKNGCQTINGDNKMSKLPVKFSFIQAGGDLTSKGFIEKRIIVNTTEIISDMITERINTKSSLFWFLILKRFMITELNNIQVIIDPSSPAQIMTIL